MKTLVFANILMLALLGCSLEPSRQSRGAAALGDEGDKDLDAEAEKEAAGGVGSLEAFQQTVYPLVREVSCKTCHADEISPLFASDRSSAAHDSVIETQKVNFETPEKSRLVLRLAEENHNCWSDCQENADEMLSAINSWIELRKAIKDSENEAAEYTTSSLTLADAQSKEGAGDVGTIFLEAESATLSQPMVAANSGAASGGSYIHTPAGNGGLLQAGNQNAGRASYSFEVQEAGSYRFWGLVNTANSNQNSFYVRVNNGPYLTWRTEVTGGDWVWDLASDQDAGGNIQSVNFTADQHTIEISQREDGSQLDVLALSNDPNFDGSGFSGQQVNVLRFDLSQELGVEGVYFEIEVSEFDQFSFKFKNPAIVTQSETVAIKGVNIALNGVQDPTQATYLPINEVVEPPGAVVSSAAMIVPTDLGFGRDEISFSFKSLKLK